MGRIPLTKEDLDEINLWIEIAAQRTSIPIEISPDWEAWVAQPVVEHMLAPRAARACLEILGRLADTGLPIETVLIKMREIFFKSD